MKTRRELIIDTVKDAASKLMYYDRKEDEELPVGSIDDAIYQGEITIDEIIEVFKKALTE